MKLSKRRKRKKHRKSPPKVHTEAFHVRLPVTKKIEIQGIARAEGRDDSFTVRCLLEKGLDDYRSTGTLYVIEAKATKKPADELRKEHQRLLDSIERLVRVARKYMPNKDKVEDVSLVH
jgi:hypothetical protein